MRCCLSTKSNYSQNQIFTFEWWLTTTTTILDPPLGMTLPCQPFWSNFSLAWANQISFIFFFDKNWSKLFNIINHIHIRLCVEYYGLNLFASGEIRWWVKSTLIWKKIFEPRTPWSPNVIKMWDRFLWSNLYKLKML